MTDNIRRYMNLVNRPRTSCIEEEMEIIEEIGDMLNHSPKVNKHYVTRYIRETDGINECVFETRKADKREMGFVIGELMKKYPDSRIFGTSVERYEVADGLEKL